MSRVDAIGFARAICGSSLRTQGPITPGVKSEEGPLLQRQNESPRRRDERNCAHAGVPEPAIGPAIAGPIGSQGRLVEMSRETNKVRVRTA